MIYADPLTELDSIRNASILLISVKAVGTEIAKNLILNGVQALTIVDDGIVSDDDLGAQYYLRDSDIGFNASQAHVAQTVANLRRERKLLYHVYRSLTHVWR